MLTLITFMLGTKQTTEEEVGGVEGMKVLVRHEEFKRLNVAFALDEGIASPKDALKVFYGERMPWWIKITATGPTGHGSQFIQDTAPTKLLKVIEKFMTLRNEQEKLLEVGLHHNGQRYTLGDVTTINLTFLQVCSCRYYFYFDGVRNWTAVNGVTY